MGRCSKRFATFFGLGGHGSNPQSRRRFMSISTAARLVLGFFFSIGVVVLFFIAASSSDAFSSSSSGIQYNDDGSEKTLLELYMSMYTRTTTATLFVRSPSSSPSSVMSVPPGMAPRANAPHHHSSLASSRASSNSNGNVIYNKGGGASLLSQLSDLRKCPAVSMDGFAQPVQISGDPRRLPRRRELIVLCIGDSITQGNRTMRPSRRDSEGSYPNELRALLMAEGGWGVDPTGPQKRRRRRNLLVLNYGVPSAALGSINRNVAPSDFSGIVQYRQTEAFAAAKEMLRKATAVYDDLGDPAPDLGVFGDNDDDLDGAMHGNGGGAGGEVGISSGGDDTAGNGGGGRSVGLLSYSAISRVNAARRGGKGRINSLLYRWLPLPTPYEHRLLLAHSFETLVSNNRSKPFHAGRYRWSETQIAATRALSHTMPSSSRPAAPSVGWFTDRESAKRRVEVSSTLDDGYNDDEYIRRRIEASMFYDDYFGNVVKPKKFISGAGESGVGGPSSPAAAAALMAAAAARSGGIANRIPSADDRVASPRRGVASSSSNNGALDATTQSGLYRRTAPASSPPPPPNVDRTVVVLFKLGTNDAHPFVWRGADHYLSELTKTLDALLPKGNYDEIAETIVLEAARRAKAGDDYLTSPYFISEGMGSRMVIEVPNVIDAEGSSLIRLVVVLMTPLPPFADGFVPFSEASAAASAAAGGAKVTLPPLGGPHSSSSPPTSAAADTVADSGTCPYEPNAYLSPWPFRGAPVVGHMREALIVAAARQQRQEKELPLALTDAPPPPPPLPVAVAEPAGVGSDSGDGAAEPTAIAAVRAPVSVHYFDLYEAFSNFMAVAMAHPREPAVNLRRRRLPPLSRQLRGGPSSSSAAATMPLDAFVEQGANLSHALWVGRPTNASLMAPFNLSASSPLSSSDDSAEAEAVEAVYYDRLVAAFPLPQLPTSTAATTVAVTVGRQQKNHKRDLPPSDEEGSAAVPSILSPSFAGWSASRRRGGGNSTATSSSSASFAHPIITSFIHDGVHPSRRGHVVMAYLIYDFLACQGWWRGR